MGEETPQILCFLLMKTQNAFQNVLLNMFTLIRFCAFVMNVIPYFYVRPTSLISFYLLACECRHQFQICLVWVSISTHANREVDMSKYMKMHENCIFNICMLHT